MAAESSNSVKYTVLVQAFKEAKTALQTARKKKKDAKEARHKGENEDISKQELHILVFEHKREKHRFKARKLKLKLIREQLRLWFKLNPKDTTPEMLTELGESKVKVTKQVKKTETDSKAVKIKKEKKVEAPKLKKVKAEKHSDAEKESSSIQKKEKKADKNKKSKSGKKSKTLKLHVSEKLTALSPIALATVETTTVSSVITPAVLPDFVTPVHITNDLTIIEGIGPKVQQVLNSHNIFSFSDLVQITADSMRQILRAHKLYMFDPTTWAEQAQLVIENKMDALKALQVELKGGKRV